MDASSGGDCEPELRGRLFLTAHEGPVQGEDFSDAVLNFVDVPRLKRGNYSGRKLRGDQWM